MYLPTVPAPNCGQQRRFILTICSAASLRSLSTPSSLINLSDKGRSRRSCAHMTNKVQRNDLKRHRKQAGLSQRELARIIGCADQSSVARHERSQTAPSLAAAIGYQVVFQKPISTIFPELHKNAARDIETRLADLEVALGQRNPRDRGANLVARQLIWLMERRNL
jgi:DNA-binding XRE family transcriptional regulator